MGLKSIRDGGDTGAAPSLASSGPRPTTGSATAPGAGGSGISDLADALGQLQRIGESDPERLRQLLDQVSARLGEEAGRASGPYAHFLSHLAGTFQQAARSRDLSALQLVATPSPTGERHRHVQRYAEAQSSAAAPPERAPSDLVRIVAGVIRSSAAGS